MPKSNTSSVLAGFLNEVESGLSQVGGKCHVGLLLEQLSDKDREVFAQALATPKYTGTAIANALNKNDLAKNVLGQEIGSSSVQRHRRRACRCDKFGA